MEATKPKILIADPDLAFMGICSLELQAEGFVVVSVQDGEAALAQTLSEQPDLVLTDVILPKKEGPEVLLELKENPKTKNIPVAFFTNLGGRPEDVKAAREIGAVDLILKYATTPRELVVRVKALLASVPLKADSVKS